MQESMHGCFRLLHVCGLGTAHSLQTHCCVIVVVVSLILSGVVRSPRGRLALGHRLWIRLLESSFTLGDGVLFGARI